MIRYGKELIADMHNCYNHKFNRESLEEFFDGLCTLVQLDR